MSQTYIDFSQVDTGDILLFSNLAEYAVGIQLATGSKWNHAGIAIWVDRDLIFKFGVKAKLVNEKTKILCVLESNYDTKFDIYTQKETDGARLTPIDAFMKRHTLIACRKINVIRDDDFYAKTGSFMEKYSGTPYRRNFFRISLGYAGISTFNKKDTICSELCAKYLNHIGLISDAWLECNDSGTIMPSDFGMSQDIFSEGVFMQNKPIIIMQRRNDCSMQLLLVILIVVIIILLIMRGR